MLNKLWWEGNLFRVFYFQGKQEGWEEAKSFKKRIFLLGGGDFPPPASCDIA